MKRLPESEFESLFLSPRCWVDVRAPIEFRDGAVPGAVNLPLLTDEERHQVGLTYKRDGQAAAIALGHRLVQGEVKEARVRAWLAGVEADKSAVIYCFRGGLRSQTTQSWLLERGVERPIVEGGYKALRRFLLGVFANRLGAVEFEVVSGLTGSGKTAYLRASGRRFLDLEEIAVHRGSAFGGWLDRPQPSQADFENAVAVELLRLIARGRAHGETILVEHESRLIGKRVLPSALFSKIQSSPRIVIEAPLDQRVENILKDYVIEPCRRPEAAGRVFDGFTRAVTAITPKLGGARAQEILRDIAFSRAEFESGRGLDSNRAWIAKLLLWYYDPMYRFAAQK